MLSASLQGYHGVLSTQESANRLRRAVQQALAVPATNRRDDTKSSNLSANRTTTIAYAAILGIGLAVQPPADAATFAVTNTNDSGAGSLRQAVLDANDATGADDINFNGLSGSINLTTGPIVVTDSLSIAGPGISNLTIDGNGANIFEFGKNGVDTDLLEATVSGLTLESGDRTVYVSSYITALTVSDVSISNSNFGIFDSSGSDNSLLLVQNSVISGNTSDGIRVSGNYVGAELFVDNSVITNNLGAGIANTTTYGFVTIRNATISDNERGVSAQGVRISNSVVSGNSSSGCGAGISSSYISINDSLVSDNTSNQNGGGICVTTGVYGGSLSISNSTVSGNSATGSGGGIFAHESFYIGSSTITGNDALEGGGIFANPPFYNNFTVLEHSIVAGNSASTVVTSDLFSSSSDTIVETNFNLIGNPGNIVFDENVMGSNLIGVDPELGPLQDNGGLTHTHAINSSSPAFNRGDPNFASQLEFDQRGDGFSRIVGGRIDIGAFEFQSVDSSSALLAALGDINGDGSEDIAVLVQDANAGTVTATVKDAVDGSLIQQISFNGALTPVALEVIDDMNGNGAPELVLLGEGSTQVEIRDSLSGELQNVLNYSPAATPIDLAIVPDQDRNGIDEVAVLSRTSAPFVSVTIKDALTKTRLSRIAFSSKYEPRELAILEDITGNGKVELAVLGIDGNAAGTDIVEIRDAESGDRVNQIFYNARVQARRLTTLTDQDGNGADELVVLRDGPANVRINDSLTDTLVNHIGFNPNATAQQVMVIPDLNSSGSVEIGVLGVNNATGQISVQIKDVETDAATGSVAFNPAFPPQDDIEVISDLNGNGSSELVYLGKRNSDGKLVVFIKDAQTKQLINRIGF